MFSRRRKTLLLTLPALYVGVAAARAGEVTGGTWALISLAVGVAILGARVPESAETETVRARTWTTAGLSIALATAALSSRPAWAACGREIAAFFASIAAIRAIRRIDGDVGLAPRATEASEAKGFGPTMIARFGIGLVTLTWGIAALVEVLSWWQHTRDTAPISSAVLGVIGIFLLGGAALLTGAARRLELSATPRTLACAGAAAMGLVAAIAVVLHSSVSVDAAAAIGATLASFVIVRIAATQDVLALARRGRRAAALLVFGGPVAALVAISVEGHTGNSTGLAFGLTVIAILVGAASRKLEEPFLPSRGVLLDALAEARDSARDREARAAMSFALVRLREAAAIGLGPTAAPSPELWLLHPTRVVTVNAAGYLQERSAELPADVFDITMGEPDGTIRTDVLRALEVRRADLRPLLSWLDQRGALFATAIADGDDPDGLLVFPAGVRVDPLTLEEVRAAKLLADSFVAVAQATSANVRHLARERDLMVQADALEHEIERLEHERDLAAGRNELASARLARPATVGIYSAASKMAYEDLERRVIRGAPVVILARAGIDPVPYVARAHLGGPRRECPLVVVDGTSTREHDLPRWKDPSTSPLALADRGLLLLVDGAALPREVQVLVARAIAERRAPWERASALDIVLTLTATSRLDALVAQGRLTTELFARFDDVDPITLPGLRDRPEDLRSIVADRLAREGLRARGTPLGIDAAAFSRLIEYPFEGEDAELASIVTRLVARAEGDVVRAADVDALALPPPADSEPAIDELARRRRS